jgi:hypothetical protein
MPFGKKRAYSSTGGARFMPQDYLIAASTHLANQWSEAHPGPEPDDDPGGTNRAITEELVRLQQNMGEAFVTGPMALLLIDGFPNDEPDDPKHLAFRSPRESAAGMVITEAVRLAHQRRDEDAVKMIIEVGAAAAVRSAVDQ